MMKEEYYHSQEEYQRDKEMHERGIYGNHLSSLLDDARERLKKLKKSPKENHWQIIELEKQIAVMEKEARLPEPKTDTKKLVGMYKVKEKLTKPLSEQMHQDMFGQRNAPHKSEDDEDENEVLNDILSEEKRHTKQLDVLIHLTQLDKIYKTPDKRREYMRKYMKEVREDENKRKK
jgi:hypothetical protein